MSSEAIAPRRVLVLYWTPTPPSEIRAAIRHHLEAIKYGPSRHRVTYWNAFDGTPPLVRRGTYDAVVLHTTLLCLRWFPTFEDWRRKLAWLGGVDWLKIAMPQDEYDHSEVLDEWLTELGVDHVFSVFGPDVRPLLYPRTSQRGSFRHAFTGYIDDDTARAIEARLVEPAARPFDVVYRATHLPYWFGSLGQLKHRIGERAEAEAAAHRLAADVSTRTEDAVLGGEWFDFLASGRTVVGCESGSSVLDRRGEIKAAITAYLESHPGAAFDEVSRHLPEGWDSHRFAAISPRHFEAVITRTAQVLVEGRYDGVFEAGRHFVPVRADLSDLGDALEKASDPAVAGELAERSYEEIYRSGHYSYRVLAEEVDRVLETRPPRRGAVGSAAAAAAARWGRFKLDRPSQLDADWKLEPVQGGAVGRLAAATRGRVGRGLLRAYAGAGSRNGSLSLAGLLAESRLLDRMAAAQRAEPRTPPFRVIRASGRGGVLELHVLRTPDEVSSPAAEPPPWPPASIVLRLPPSRRAVRAGGPGAGGMEIPLAAVSALARLDPKGVQAALLPLLDVDGGPRSRPGGGGRRSGLKRFLATGRLLATRPVNVWWLATAVGRAPLGDTADDLLKLSLLASSADGASVRTQVDAKGEVTRIVWDNSAVSRHAFAPIALGKRATVFLGAAGVHEFTALERLPAGSRRAILRRLRR